MSKQAFKRLRRRLSLEVNRKPVDAYAWPGGYPLYYLTEDCAALCPECVNREIDLIDQAKPHLVQWSNGRTWMRSDDPKWNIVAVMVNWEDASMYCDHCNRPIESAYGEDEDGRLWVE
jgi:hypothetical protein